MSMDTNITVDADHLRVTFDGFGPDAYALFLRAKRLPEYTVLLDADGLACGLQAPARFAALLGVTVPEWPAVAVLLGAAA